MDYEQVTCVLDLAALVCYGFLIFALLFYWPNEANVYLVFFCLSNAILAFVGAYGTAEPGEHCRWNGILTLLAISMGFESLYCSHRHRKTLVRHQFRLYKSRPNFIDALSCFFLPFIFAFIPWSFYEPIRQFNACFLKSSSETALEDTVLSFIWISFFYLRPILLTFNSMPVILWEWYKQTEVLKHENELPMDGKFVLYKDHHRRLFHVIFTMATVILFIVWIFMTMPYSIQMLSMIGKLDSYLRLGSLPVSSQFLLEVLCKSIPVVNCLIFVGAFVSFFVLKI